MGVGTWAWGDRNVWGMGGYDAALTEDAITQAWNTSIDAGVELFDTAEVYGDGESERIIGRLLAADPERAKLAIIASKFMPVPWKLDVKGALRKSLEASLERLGLQKVALYQIHGPVSLRGHRALAEALAAVHADGLVEAVGVSNYSEREMRSIAGHLADRGVALASNQIEFSLLRRDPETSGLIAACQELDVVPLAYSPLGQGRLTGKYSAANPPEGKRNFANHPMETVDRLVATLREVGEPHDRSPAQVALNWLIAKGAVPIPGAKNAKQAADNAGGGDWMMSSDDVARLDAVALAGPRSIQSRFWQHG